MERNTTNMQKTCQLSAEDHQMAETFENSLRLNGVKDTKKSVIEEQVLYHEEEEEEEEEEAEEELEEEEEEFSFFYDGENTSPIAAEDAFVNGQIKPRYPLFNQDLVVEESDLGQNFPVNPQVKNVFVEMKKECSASGQYGELPKKLSGAEGCKKSNSTGFSKLRRFKDFMRRSNSDGKDAFVFLNNHETTSSEAGKKKTATPLSAHEVYLKKKAQENDGRKSYLPYKRDVFGFFTNVNGGITKNVHPF